MVWTDQKKAQAAVELAVFGAILVFVLGTIVRTSVGNSYTQNENFKAMRMAMLLSWQGSESSKGLGAAANTAHNTASILFIEDRLSPDFNKYGDVDRNAYIAQGSGSFSYEMLYPLDVGEAANNLPIMDVYINGMHFPFTTASYVTNQIHRPGDASDPGAPAACGSDGPYEFPKDYPITQAQCLQNQCLRNEREWVGTGSTQYKLFYTMAANGTNQFFTSPPDCTSTNSTACKDKALSLTLTTSDPVRGTTYTNPNGEMMYDLLRTGDAAAVDVQFPYDGSSPIRNDVAWQWAATAGTSAAMIGLDATNNQYPTYDIDGRLKEVTIYGISRDQATGDPIVTYEDYQGGDIDSSWDTNSCGPKAGLQNNSQILTFTKDGTYLEVREGKMYNPETGQEVRSINQRNSIDVIQRTIQLSNNTGRFCSGTTPLPCVGGAPSCPNDPNPVEVCVNGTGDTCFNGANAAKTCYDTVSNIIYVRSRLEDRRGNFWMTNASGQLQVQ